MNHRTMSGDEADPMPPSVRIATAITAVRSVDSTDLDPLPGWLDFDAIDDLFANSSASICVECTVEGLVVATAPERG